MCDPRSGGVGVPATMTFEDFTSVEDNVVLCAKSSCNQKTAQTMTAHNRWRQGWPMQPHSCPVYMKMTSLSKLSKHA